MKSDSYFKIKSGIFGGDLDIDGLEEVDSTDLESLKKFEDKEIKRNENFAKYQRNLLKSFYADTFFNEDSSFSHSPFSHSRRE